jgi:hypothetical protein
VVFYRLAKTLADPRLFPNLTHLAIPLFISFEPLDSMDVAAAHLLASLTLRKLVVFALVDPRSAAITKLKWMDEELDKNPENIDAMACGMTDKQHTDLSTYYQAAEPLESIYDDRLILVHYVELTSAYKLSNEAFWAIVERF